MGSKPKAPAPIPARAELVDLDTEKGGRSNFEEELKKRQKRKQTTLAGETGGYGGNTQLG
jgi:hypothetical protein